MRAFLNNLLWCVVGVLLGLFAAQPFEDYLLPRVMKPKATVTPVTSGPYGRQVAIKVTSGPVLPDHRLYVVVESDGRYWPQDEIPPLSTGEYLITLGAASSGDVGRTFTVHVVDVSGSAEAQVSDYFVELSHPGDASVRHTGIDFARSRGQVRFVRSLALTREQ